MWAYGLLLTMFVIVREQLWGKLAAPDPLMFGLAYSTYIIVPVLMMFRVAQAPIFSHKIHLE